MTIQPGANVYTQGFGSRPENVEVPHIDVRAPASTDVLYPIGKTWVDHVGNAAYTLTGLSTSQGVVSATWVTTGGGSGAVSQLTGDSGTATPSGGSIKIAGTANQITTTGSGSTVTLALAGPYTPATYTAHGVLIGEGTSSIVATAVGATGTVLSGNTGADPTFQALTGLAVTSIAGTANQITASAATGAVTLSTPSTFIAPGSIAATTTVIATLGNITATNGNLSLGTAGNKIVIATGSNASVGTSAAMSGTPGAVTVATTASSATAKIFYSRNVTGGTPGEVSITAQDGTGFTLTSTANETSTFNWWIINT